MSTRPHYLASLAALTALLALPLASAQIPPPPPSVLASTSLDLGPAVVQPGLVFAQLTGFRPLRLDLYRPKNATQPLPLVLWLHGGAWIAGDASGGAFAGTDWPVTLAELAGRGYVVASLTYRLSGEARYPAQIQDVRTAIRWLRTHAAEYGIDGAHLFAMGGSAGGYLAALAGVSCGDATLDAPTMPAAPGAPPVAAPVPRSECVQGVVAFYPVTDIPMLAKAPSTGTPNDSAASPIGRLLGCAIATCAKALVDSASVLARVDAKDPPFLMFHGDADTLVPIDQSRALDAALKSAGVASDLVVVSGANHVFPGLSAQAQRDILDRVWKFLDLHSGKKR